MDSAISQRRGRIGQNANIHLNLSLQSELFFPYFPISQRTKEVISIKTTLFSFTTDYTDFLLAMKN